MADSHQKTSHKEKQSDDEHAFSEEEFLCQGNTQGSINNSEHVSSAKVLNEKEITNITQLYELVKSGKATDVDIT